MGEKVTATTTEATPWSEVGAPGDWSQEARDQQLRDLKVQGHTELAEHYEQGDQVRADLARDREDPHGVREWDERGAQMAAETGIDPRFKPETAVETPRRKSLKQRLAAKVAGMFVRKPAEPNQFEQRDNNGW